MDELRSLTRRSLDQAIQSGAVISRDAVVAAIDAGDLNSWRLVYDAICDAYAQISPLLAREAAQHFLIKYFLRCIGAAADTDFSGELSIDDPLSPYEAAQELKSFLARAWVERDPHKSFDEIAHAVTELYDRSEDSVKHCIETGFLEHVLEHPELRDLFRDWSADPRRRGAFERALEWGRAHEARLTDV